MAIRHGLSYRGGHGRAGNPAALWVVLAMLTSVVPSIAATEPPSEYQVKAAFLFKFGEFVDWPHTAFKNPESPATLCILGVDPFGEALDKAVAGQHIGERGIVVKRLAGAAEAAECHILFIGAKPGVADVRSAFRGMSVLTITDAAASSEAGIINFVIKNNRVRFEIDDAAASTNGLGISSKLLSLAVSTKPRG